MNVLLSKFEHKLSEYPEEDRERIISSARWSWEQHGVQKRASGELYFTHPLQVADILVDMKIDGSWYRMFNQIEGYKIANKDFNKSLKDLGYYYKMVCGWSAGFYKIEKE